VATFVLAPIAYMSMFTGFHAYDDEGYNLANLSDYLAGHPLLPPNALGYGPFFYEIFGGLFKVLGLVPDNDTGRIVTTAIWLIASVAGGLVAFRLSRNLWLGIAAELATFGILIALGNEPMSPYGLSAILLLGLAPAASFRSARPRASAVAIGAIVSALCLVKINIGGFAAVAVVLAWSASLPQRWRRPLLATMVAVVIALPFLLTFPLLTRGWVFAFAAVVGLSAASVGVASLAVGPRALPPSSSGWIAAGGAVVLIACVGAALSGGTRPNDIWNGLVVQPLRIPGLLTLPVTVGAGHVVWAAVSLVMALALTVRNKIATLPPTAAGLMRVGAGFFTFLSLLLVPNTIFLLALPLAWLATQAPDDPGADPAGSYARVLLPALAVIESLQAYPFAGSQLSLAAFCVVPVGAITLGDGIRQLRGAGVADRATVKALRWVAPAALAINVAVFLLFALTVAAGFGGDTPVGLPGAKSVRLPAQSANQLRLLVAAVDRDCSSLVTFPGMNSFYIWTGQDPPPMRVEVWWLFLDSSTQQSIVQQLSSQPRLCVIKNQRVIDMWSAGRDVPSSPLVDFIGRQFVHDSSYGDYELLVRVGT
jgi:hypothetical protein